MKKSTKNLINIVLIALMFVVLYFLEQHFGRRSMLITVLKKGAIYALIAGIVVCCKEKNRKNTRGMAIAGIVLSVLALLIA